MITLLVCRGKACHGSIFGCRPKPGVERLCTKSCDLFDKAECLAIEPLMNRRVEFEEHICPECLEEMDTYDDD